VKSAVSVLLCVLLATVVSGCNAKETKSSKAETGNASGTEPKVALVPLAPGGNKPVAE